MDKHLFAWEIILKMTTVAVSSDEAVETEYDSDTFDDESIEEQFSKRNIEAVAPQTKVLSDNSVNYTFPVCPFSK